MSASEPFAIHRERTRELAERFMRLVTETERERAADMLAPLRAALDRIESRRFVVAVVGRQKSGKSTLMNALVGEVEPVSPVNARVWTSALSIVRHGDQSLARIHLDPSFARTDAQPQTVFTADESMLKRARQLFRRLAGRVQARSQPPQASATAEHPTLDVPRSELAAWVTHDGNPNNYKGVVLAEVFSRSPLLADGMVLVDSPGIGALTENDSKLAGVVADEVDATVMVYTKDANLGREEMDFLVTSLALRRQHEETGRVLRRKVFLVQNDRAPGPDDDPQTIEDECRKVAAQTQRMIEQEWKHRQADNASHPRGPPPVERIERVNAKRAERAVRLADEKMLEESNVPAVRQALLQFYVYGRAQALLADASMELRNGVARAASDVQQRLDFLAQETQEAHDRILRFSEHRSRLKSEDEKISEGGIRNCVEQASVAEVTRITGAVGDELSSARKRIEEAADVPGAADGVADWFKNAIARAILNVDKGASTLETAYEALLAALATFESEGDRIVAVGKGCDPDADKSARTRRGSLELETTLSGSFQRFISKVWNKFPWGSRDNVRKTLLKHHDESTAQALNEARARAESVVQAHAAKLREDLLKRRAAVRARTESLEEALRREHALKGEERKAARARLDDMKRTLGALLAEVEEHVASLET